MPLRKTSLRRRPATPNLNVAQIQAQVQDQNEPLAADPNSPPETPTTSPFLRKSSLKPRRQPDFHDYFQPLDSDPNIKPVGDGHQFSYRPSLGPEQLSPRSSSSSEILDNNSSDEDSSSEDDDQSASPSIRSIGNATGPAVSSPINDSDMGDDTDSSNDSDTSESDSSSESGRSGAADKAETSHITATSMATATCNFTLEDVDPMDSDCDGLDVLQPTEIESNRSRSRSRNRKDHKTMVKDFRNLNCSNEASDNEQGADVEGEVDAEVLFYQRREQIKKLRRMSMGSSFGKRTHSELSDSEDDGEGLDANEVGSSARRMKRKMHRTSLLFHDPPHARIEELDEPDSSEEEELVAQQHLARELPYWAIEIMEMDSS
ncbi:hypothetical protein FHETE_3507 [Fusarium heterosporum]|uniref:Uncharacterized protein n=1 Tax=Fusarium heterosporum TaxID=42747 RepID=A0A8H5WRR1_FUSHE|nr:hypothetical protein FHETE_3507 [Fusarium heterosporum]